MRAADLVRVAFAGRPPANAANPANTRADAGDPGLRTAANGCESQPAPAPIREDSQAFAEPETRTITCDSQDSQVSQGCAAAFDAAAGIDPAAFAAALAAVVWTDADIGRFLGVQGRLLRWGWPEPEAEALAERIVRAQREGDDRRACVECSHLRAGRRCGNPRADFGPELPRDLVALVPKRCAGFAEAPT